MMRKSEEAARISPLAITMGCPVGIGPEIILRFLAQAGRRIALWPVVIGDLGVLRRSAATLEIPFRVVDWQPGALLEPQALNVLSLSDLGQGLCWGKPTMETGRAMGRYIEEGVRLVRQGQLAGLVTCPIGKAALRAGGYRFPGHTEMLAELCQARDYAMMMAGNRLKVTLVSIHQPLAEVPAAITLESVQRMIVITARALRDDFGLPRPRLAVAGLNPHAGEAGLFGDEEQRVIVPAVAASRRAGWLVEGPFPPDTVFHKAAAGQFDAVVCMYHDQGLIPFKLLHFSDGVNVTLGLPIVRTSVDHGTAYDIAGQGVADPASLAAAFFMAEAIIANRKKGLDQRGVA
jgi:4-hydroxythreonine-4-phosphate dehydrogenase